MKTYVVQLSVLEMEDDQLLKEFPSFDLGSFNSEEEADEFCGKVEKIFPMWYRPE